MFFLILLFFISCFTFIYSILYYSYQDKIVIQKRLRDLEGRIVEDKELLTFSQRVIKPIYDMINRLLSKLTPSYKLVTIAKKLERAGYPKDFTPERWIFVKYTSVLIIFLLSYMLFSSIQDSRIKSIFISLLTAILTNVIFNVNLSSKIQGRRKRILKDLPYILDLITVSVEAGLSFDGAIARVITIIKGDLSDEFAKTLKEIRMGIPRKIALKNMSDRNEVRELSMFVTSLIQADELGVSLGKVLRIESQNLRERRKQMAKEKAMKVPIKMLFPLVFFIFPTIFIILLGPAIIKAIEMFTR